MAILTSAEQRLMVNIFNAHDLMLLGSPDNTGLMNRRCPVRILGLIWTRQNEDRVALCPDHFDLHLRTDTINTVYAQRHKTIALYLRSIIK
jgi:hypothetical protein